MQNKAKPLPPGQEAREEEDRAKISESPSRAWPHRPLTRLLLKKFPPSGDKVAIVTVITVTKFQTEAIERRKDGFM